MKSYIVVLALALCAIALVHAEEWVPGDVEFVGSNQKTGNVDEEELVRRLLANKNQPPVQQFATPAGQERKQVPTQFNFNAARKGTAAPKPEAQFTEEQLNEIDSIVEKVNLLRYHKNFTEALDLLKTYMVKYSGAERLYSAQGAVYFNVGNFRSAERAYQEAYKANPKNSKHLVNVARCLYKLGNPVDSLFYWRRAYNIDKDPANLVGMVFFMWMESNWENYEVYSEEIMTAVRSELAEGRLSPINPFMALSFPFSMEELQKISASHAKRFYDETWKYGGKQYNYSYQTDPDNLNRRIRIGYISNDFRNHAVGLAVRSMLSYHDKSRFEVHAYSINDGTEGNFRDKIYRQVERSAEFFHDIGELSYYQIADQINADGIDILIDLGMFTGKMEIMSLRPAPIQIGYLGMASTTGSTYFDYFVVDPVVIEDEEQQWFSEKLIYMPHTYHVFDHRNLYGDPTRATFPPDMMKIFPEHDFLYCNFATSIRLDKETFTHWMNIINSFPDATLILKHQGESQVENIKREAAKYGVYAWPDNDERFQPEAALRRMEGLEVEDDILEDHYAMPNPTPAAAQKKPKLLFMRGTVDTTHIALKRVCDVFLDLHQYNGHSTAGDMLWAGVPMVTYPGNTMASRAAASLAVAVGTPQSVQNSWEEYENFAKQLYYNRTLLEDMRRHLDEIRYLSPVFDQQRWVRNFETALTTIFHRLLDGEPASNIKVADYLEAANVENK